MTTTTNSSTGPSGSLGRTRKPTITTPRRRSGIVATRTDGSGPPFTPWEWQPRGSFPGVGIDRRKFIGDA